MQWMQFCNEWRGTTYVSEKCGGIMYFYKDTEKSKSPGTDFILAILLHADGRTPHSEMNKLTVSI
jgi:hypothetical protein